MIKEIHRMTCQEYLHDHPRLLVDAVITDPPYDMPKDEFQDILNSLIKVCSGNIIVFCKPENQFFIPDEYLFWIKTPSTKNYIKNCGRFVEMILVLRRGYVFNQLHWSQMIGVYDDKLVYPPKHPWQKPLSLVERLVRIYTNPCNTILDPFMGSGQVGIAAKSLDRRFIGIESDPAYFNLAERNLDDNSDMENV